MLTDKVLQEVVAPVACMLAFIDITGPPFEMAMTFVLVSNPVSLSLEHLWLATVIPGASKRLDILVDMLGPIRRLDKLAGTVTDPTFKFL